MFETVEYEKRIMAIIIYSAYEKEGVTFFTEKECSQQLGFMKHKKGKIIAPHYHNKVLRQIDTTMEALFIRRGKMKVYFYSENKCIDSRILTDRDVIMLYGYGHSFEMLEDTEFIEIKQGPYDEQNDKTLIQLEKKER